MLALIGRGDDKSSLKSRLATAVPELADADESVLDRLLESAQIVKRYHDRFVFHAGGLCQAFLILLDGEVRVQLTAANGREATPYRIGPAGFLPAAGGRIRISTYAKTMRFRELSLAPARVMT